MKLTIEKVQTKVFKLGIHRLLGTHYWVFGGSLNLRIKKFTYFWGEDSERLLVSDRVMAPEKIIQRLILTCFPFLKNWLRGGEVGGGHLSGSVD